MSGKVAILYYGQPRVFSDANFALSSLRAYCQRHGQQFVFDTYMHVWSVDIEAGEVYDSSSWSRGSCGFSIPSGHLHDFVMKTYRPVKCIFEKQKKFDPDEYLHVLTRAIPTSITHDIPNMISQMHSLAEVCKSVQKWEGYDYFILIRMDSILQYWDFPLLDSLDRQSFHFVQDFVNIFGKNVMALFRRLMPFLLQEPLISPCISAEALRFSILDKNNIQKLWLGNKCSVQRSTNRVDTTIDTVRGRDWAASFISSQGVTIRAVTENTYVCSFSIKTEPRGYQWVGAEIPGGGPFTVSYRFRFLKRSPESLGSSVGSKTHNPDVVHFKWIQDLSKAVGDWYDVKIGSVDHPLTSINNPFLFIIFDQYINTSEIIVEISDVNIARL